MTARAMLQIRLEETRAMTEKILRNLEEMENEIDSAKVDWGHVGNIGHVEEELAGVCRFLGI